MVPGSVQFVMLSLIGKRDLLLVDAPDHLLHVVRETILQHTVKGLKGESNEYSHV